MLSAFGQVEGLHALNGLSCGGLHGVAQQQTGQLLAWGANQNGVLGLGSELIQSQRSPMPLQKTFASQVLFSGHVMSGILYQHMLASRHQAHNIYLPLSVLCLLHAVA